MYITAKASFRPNCPLSSVSNFLGAFACTAVATLFRFLQDLSLLFDDRRSKRLARLDYEIISSLRLRFYRHVTTIYVTLTCSPFWTCDNQGNNVSSNAQCPSYAWLKDGSVTIWQPLVMREKWVLPEWLMAVTGKMIASNFVTSNQVATNFMQPEPETSRNYCKPFEEHTFPI